LDDDRNPCTNTIGTSIEKLLLPQPIPHRHRRMIRPTPRMLNSTLHPSPLRPPGQPRSGHLIIDPPPRIVVKSPPPIRPPRIRTHLTRMQSPHHIHIPGLI